MKRAFQKEIKTWQLRRVADEILCLESQYSEMSDEELAEQTRRFRSRMQAGEPQTALMRDAFATVREAAFRVLGYRHHAVQLMGGAAMFFGMIAEMKTGEGKTLTAGLPAYLHALVGKGVHLVTVNEYLVKRDCQWVGAVLRFLGLTTGLITHDMDEDARRQAYKADVTYGVNSEFGFDYLRDNMVNEPDRRVQRGHPCAIIDEIDSILIDESRTPLLISGGGDGFEILSGQADRLVRYMKPKIVRELDDYEAYESYPEDYIAEQKSKTVFLTDAGVKKVEWFFRVKMLYQPENLRILHAVLQALKAYGTMEKDVDYIVKDGEVAIVDEFTGRVMRGRRFTDGLHQAIEAKEELEIHAASRTLASITYQNYFRRYERLSGMTGTAKGEKDEFEQVYGLSVVVIPPNRPTIRTDHSDRCFLTAESKAAAVIAQVQVCRKKGQPVLIGTVSVERSNELSALLNSKGIPHRLLNATHPEAEAAIIADAGLPGAVTVATNMAGRGTDILLGGAAGRYRAEVGAAGGLYVIGTERHDSRRIDWQLIGRAGRQGSPGESCFFISLEDDVVRRFGQADQHAAFMRKHPGKAVVRAQRRAESIHTKMRYDTLQYDAVLEEHRVLFYEQRNRVLTGTRIREAVEEMIRALCVMLTQRYAPGKWDEWDLSRLESAFNAQFEPCKGLRDGLDASGFAEDVGRILETFALQAFRNLVECAPEKTLNVVRTVLLKEMDSAWQDHVDTAERLKVDVSLYCYGQKDPLREYRRLAYKNFDEMTVCIREKTVQKLFLIKKCCAGNVDVYIPKIPHT